jgi:hypothetical protein
VTDDELMQQVNKLAAAYRQTLSELELEVYVEDLRHLDAATLLTAFRVCKQSARPFMPTTPEILAAAQLVRQVTAGDPRPEDETAALLKKIARYNPDIGVVNDGTRGLIYGGQRRGEDNPDAGFTDRERRILRLFGGAARMAGWDGKDVQFNRPRLIEAFGQAAEDERVAEHHARIAGGSAPELPPLPPLRRIGGGA